MQSKSEDGSYMDQLILPRIQFIVLLGHIRILKALWPLLSLELSCACSPSWRLMKLFIYFKTSLILRKFVCSHLLASNSGGAFLWPYKEALARLQQFAFSSFASHAGIRNAKSKQTNSSNVSSAGGLALALALLSRCFWDVFRVLNDIIRPHCFFVVTIRGGVQRRT